MTQKIRFAQINPDIQVLLDEKLSDAPVDGKTYGRKNEAWVETMGGGGGVEAVVAGSRIAVDATEPARPVVSVALGEDENFVTDAEKATLSKTSGVNTGDQDLSAYDAHLADTGNPHAVTKSQVGLGNVDNTSDIDKPVSTAGAAADNLRVLANAAIVGGTKTKITYDAKGLVTAGSDASQDDISAGSVYGRLTNVQIVDLTDGGDSPLHYHAADRNRANHTGTQLASTISNFASAALAAAPAETESTLGTLINSAPVHANMNDTDKFSISVSSMLKSVSWAKIKETLRTYFNTLYPTLSSTRYCYPFGSYTAMSPISTSPAFPFSSTLPSFITYPKQYSQAVWLTGLSDASNYWVVTLHDFGTATAIASVSTSGLASGTGYLLTTTTMALSSLTQAANRYLYVTATKVGSPGNLFAHSPAVEYTLA